jgi:hypothetical protein
MELTEEAITYLEERIPEMAERATRQAFLETLARGESVLIAEGGYIVKVFPDGTRKVIKKIAPHHIVSKLQYTIS